MAVSSILQCYQAVRRHLKPHYDSIWISDSLLAAAFERYAAPFRTGARYGSSVPGPMEHRKRLAKRHMGELRLGQPHAGAPIWELASLVDLTQWKWKPPALPDARRQQNSNPDSNTSKTGALSDDTLNPLRLLFPEPTGRTADEPRALDDVLLPQNVALSGVAEALPSFSWDADSTPLDVIDAALEPLARAASSDTEAISLFSRFCRGWEQALARGLFNGEAVGTVLTGITDGLNVKFADADGPMIIERLEILLMDATIEGMSKGETCRIGSFDHVAWNSIFRAVSKVRLNTIRAFTKAIACVPQSHLGAVLPGIRENLYVFWNTLGRVAEQSTLNRQTAKMAVPFRRLGGGELRFILDDATRKLLENNRVDDVKFTRARFVWLLFLARLPSVDQEYLAQVCTALEGGSLVDRPLTELEICRLFIVWEHHQSPLKHYVGLLKVLKRSSTRCYRLLSIQLWTSRQFYRVKHFSAFLHAIGREAAVNILAKASSYTRRKGCTSLARIAFGMRKPQTAIDILYLFEKSRRHKSSFWGSRFGFEALEILTWVPGFDHRRLWRALKIIPSRQLKNRCSRRQLKGLSKQQIIRMSTAGIVTGLSPHLSRRKAFSLIMDCCLNLQRHNTKLPRPFLRALIHNATRQLVDGEPGVTSRLRYVLYIIEQQVGWEEARRIGLAMERRRRQNFGLE
ncbi:hypothetical protein F5B17DRAFT_207422 [Nemania serpens]|nr:hypothetical protein F5B17DRAFT_207422 [Nemania serpens]